MCGGDFIDHLFSQLRQKMTDCLPRTLSRIFGYFEHGHHAALDHYLDWCRSPAAEKKYPHASNVNRESRLELAAFLANHTVCGNSRKGSPRPMKSQGFVLDVA